MALTMLLLVACSKNHNGPAGDDGSGLGDDSATANDTGTHDDSGTVVDADHDDDGWDADLDCDDGDPNVHPEADEQCLNGIDDDCDSVIDHCELCSQLVAASEYEWTGWSYGEVSMLETPDNTAVWTLAASADGHNGKYVVGLRADTSSPVTVIAFDDGTVPRALATRSDLDGDELDELVIAGAIDVDHSAGWIFSSPIPDGSIDADEADASFVGAPDAGVAYVRPLPALTIAGADPADGLFVGDGSGRFVVPGPLSGAIDLSDDPRVLPVADRPADAVTTDLDGDGTSDLFIGQADANETTRPQDTAIRVYFGPLPAAPLDDATADRSWVDSNFSGYPLAAGDFDGDGRGDVFATSAGCVLPEACQLSLLTQDSAAGSLDDGAAAIVLGTLPFVMSAVESADFNLDGVSDLVVGAGYAIRRPDDDVTEVDGRVSVLLGPFEDGQSLFDDANAQVSSCKKAWERFGFDVATGDYDGDGTPDIATTTALGTENWESSRGSKVQIMPSTLFVEP